MQMRYGRYVGRVGALAVALGIGVAVAAPAGFAWAIPDDSVDSSSTSGTNSNNKAAGSSATPSPATDTTAPESAGGTTGTSTDDSKSTEPVDPKSGSSTTDEVAPGVTVSSSGGAHSDASDADEDAAKPKSKKSTVNTRARTATTSKATSKLAQQPAEAATTGSTASEDEADQAAQTTISFAPSQQSATMVPAALAAAPPAATNPIQASISTLLTNIVRPVLTSFLGVFTDGPIESPLAWLALAAARRQVGTTEDVTTEVAAQRMAATQTVAAATADQPPTAAVTWSRPDATTGTVSGQLTTSDPEGKAVTVALKSGPTAGTFAYNATTRVITYTPTTAQRFVAATTSNPDDTIAMTITVSDGVNSVDVPVGIPVSPSPFYKDSDITGVTNPSAVAATSTRAYIANRDTGTVTVYDTIRNTVVGTYQVGAAPDGVAVKRDGTKLYVSSSTNNTVTVIDTATGAVKATIAVANPTAITINPSGSTVYVANGGAATVTKISTSYNKVTGTVQLAAGLTPTELAVSSDGKKIYVASTKATGGGNISVFTSSATTATAVTDIAGKPTGLAVSATFPRVFVSADNGAVTVVDTSTNTPLTINIGVPLTGIAVSNDSSVVMVTNNTGLVAALNTLNGSVLAATAVRDSALPPMSVQPGVVLSPDGTQLFVTDYDTDTVHIVSLVPPNLSPFSSDPVYNVSNPSTGALAGRVGVVDFDGDPLTYVVTSKPTKGTLVLKADGTYTYTPTSTARHAAAVPGAPDSVTTDSVTITVSDGRNGSVTTTIPLAIDPANKVPTVITTIGTPSTSTGIVKGTVKGTDGDYDKRIYTVTGAPAKGTVSITSTGSFTYTPTAEARAAATAPGASHADKQDTFTVTVDDGHGGVVPVAVNVKIGAANVKPTGATATVTNTNPRSGVVTGAITASDADGDTLQYTAAAPKKGTLVVNPNGTFTYTPTAAARLAASQPGASTTTKSETITITVTDGFGGKTTTSLKVSIAPNPTTDVAPTNGHVVPGSTTTSTAIGTVTGTVTADDADGDALTYSLGSGPAFGVAKVSSTGQFTYTPDVDARYRALVTTGDDPDSFTVNISDGFGGTTTATVNVTIAPPSASAIDQRPTSVAVTTQQMYFYSQTDTNKAMVLLKNAGIDTIRILMPWAGVESDEGTFDWGAVDRMVNSANANGIKVLAVINSTPDWAAVPDQPPLAGAPVDLDAFNDFVTAVATRYSGKVADYEIWNEQNADIFWAPAPDAAQYTALLKVAYTAIKAADPNAMVIAGGVASAAETPGGPTINPVTFLSEMYAAGAGGYFDAMAYHPYLYSLQFSDGEGHAGVPITQVEQLYAVMVANGDGNKKIWATEYGEPTSAVSEASQAAYIGDFLRTWRTLDFAGPAFIHTFADYPSNDAIESSFGLFHQDWTPKLSLATVEQVLAENEAINAAADDDVL